MKKKGGKALVEQDQNAANLAVCLSVCVPFFELSGVMEWYDNRNYPAEKPLLDPL